ncbi:hypothetical protein PINS_up003409 [Pythium insidiosum]|nr:hypothetical protein PINS_up003409 [Pythium insidiosum]
MAPSSSVTSLSSMPSVPSPDGALHDGDILTSDAQRSRLLRHREACRRSYKKKVTVIEALKQELQQLEHQYSSLLNASRSDSDSDSDSRMLTKYVELAQVKKRLIRENEELYELNAKHMTVEGRLQQIMDQDAPEPLDQLAFYFNRLTDSDIAPIIAVARDDILRFTNSSDKLSFEASVFGWVDYRKVQGNELKFALEKKFTGTPTILLLERTWSILSSPERCAKLFNPAVRADMYLLQRINNDTVLIYRSVETESVDLALKTIYILTRIQVPEGYMIFFRSIDPELINFDEKGVNTVLEEMQQDLQSLQLDGTSVRPTKKPSTWVDMYTWILFIEEGPVTCRFQFGGSTMSNVWLKEVLFIALRWETMTVGPQRLLGT